MVIHSDVTVVGAGPAGCFLAVLLARSGVKVTLIEQHKTLDREFRGNAFQPAVRMFLDQMDLGGLLDELDHQKVSAFNVRDHNGPLLTLPLSALPEPYNYAFITPQTPLLNRLVEEAARYPNFRFMANCPVKGVVLEQGAVSGVMADVDGERRFLRSRLVVAADGRFSAVRRDLGIGLDKSSQDFDFVWFEMPRVTETQNYLGLTLDESGILINLPKEHNTSQVGWVIAKGSFQTMKQAGLKSLYERVSKVDPELGTALPDHLKDFNQCSLLDVKIGQAETWCRDGLLLIGDSAHIASPIGAQGNKLAIEDAVWVHPLIVKALQQKDTVIGPQHFSSFTGTRKRDVNQMLTLQRILGRVMIDVKHPALMKVRRFIMQTMNRLPIKKKLVKRMAIGPRTVSVSRDCFNHARNENPKHIFHRLRVKEIIKETNRCNSFVLEVPTELQSLFEYKAGQFITVRVLYRGRLLKRCYSLSSTQGLDLEHRITVKTVPEGRVSSWFNRQVKVGDFLWALAPAGGFVHKPQPEARRHFFLFAAGSGVVPLFSILRSVLHTEPDSKVTFLYGNHDAQSIIFKDALDALCDQHPLQLKVVHKLERFNPESVNQFLDNHESDDLTEREYFMCGPEGMMDTVHRVLKKRNISGTRVHLEKFASMHGEEDRKHSKVQSQLRQEMGHSDAMEHEIPVEVEVKLNGKEQTIPIRKDETILDAALRAGLPVPYSCLSGVCATCTAKLRSGKVTMESSDALSEIDLKRNNILTCQAVQLSRNASVNFDVL